MTTATTSPVTLGVEVADWIETNLVHAEGDFYGEPFQLDGWQRDFLADLYRLDNDGHRVVRRAVLGLGKGNGKTELAAAIGLAELAGPTMWDGKRPTLRPSPNIPIAAVNFDQANLVFGAAAHMAREGRLAPFVHVYDTEIRLRDRPGRMFRVAAVAGGNDGGLPTAAIFDELHEWAGKERVHLVISNSLSKRSGGLELNISTAGAAVDSLLGRLWEYGRRVESGEVADPSFLFRWYQGDDDADLDNDEELAAAVAAANPASWLSHGRIIQRLQVDRMPAYEFRRYHLNQWTATATQWIPVPEWDDCADPREVPAGTEVTVGFDGSYNGDSTALVASTLDGYVFVVGCWEHDGTPDWRVPREDVMAAIHDLFGTYRVAGFFFDKAYWASEMQQLADRYGAEVVLEFPPTTQRIGPACGRFYAAVTDRRLTHDGSPVLRRHIEHAAPKDVKVHGQDMVTITKSERHRRIDAAIAAVVAYDRAMWHHEQEPAEVSWL